MKKIFAIVSIAAVIAACNNGTTEKTVAVDSATAAESPLMDAVSTADSVGKMIVDSNHMMMDTSHKK